MNNLRVCRRLDQALTGVRTTMQREYLERVVQSTERELFQNTKVPASAYSCESDRKPGEAYLRGRRWRS